MPSSLNISTGSTTGSRAWVDEQSDLIIGGTENIGAVIGKEGDSRLRIDRYKGKDITNHDTMRTTGGSLGLQAGRIPVSSIGFNQNTRDREGRSGSIDMDDLDEAVMDANSEVTSDFVGHDPEIYDKVRNKLIEDIRKNEYKLGNEEFIKKLSQVSGTKDTTIPSIYFGFYFLPKDVQSRYLSKDSDGILELRFDLLDSKGYEKIR